MEGALGFLVVRADDLVLLSVDAEGCVVEGRDLRAVDERAALVVTFPPQAITETKVVPASVEGAALAPVSLVTVPLVPGATIPLTVDGVLGAIAAQLDAASAQIESPYGLILAPAAATLDHSAPPLESSDVFGLWQTSLRAAGGLRANPIGVDGIDDSIEFRPLSKSQRGTIFATGAGADVTRWRLSALGATFSAHLSAGALEWDHDMALGRDQHVRFEQQGRIFPFGHRATLTEYADRQLVDGTAYLRRTSTLTIAEPLRIMPADGSREERQFPFHAVTLLTTSLSGFERKAFTFDRPTEMIQAVEAKRATQAIEIDEASAVFGRLVSVLSLQPRDMFALMVEGVEEFFPSAQEAAFNRSGAERELGEALAELQQIRDDMEGPEPGPPPAPGVIANLEAKIRELKLRIRNELQPALDAELAQINSFFPPGQPITEARAAELGFVADLPAMRQRLAELDAEIARLRVPIDRVSRLHHGDGTAVEISVRLSGRLGDIEVRTPVAFVHDAGYEAGDTFPAYRTFDDPELLGHIAASGYKVPKVGTAGQPVDLVRRPGGARAVDIQEVHALQLAGRHIGDDFRPVLESFDIDVPELRSLLPDLETRRTATLSSGVLGGAPGDAPIELRPPVDVNFAGAADRGGGLLSPSFKASVISEQFGPTDPRLLPGGTNPMAALQNMRLFGISLSSLLNSFSVPPAITQIMGTDGLPRGVELHWEGQTLKTVGPFVAHGQQTAAPTVLTLHIVQTAELRTTECTMSAFMLDLPTAGAGVVTASFESLAFRQIDGHPPTLEVGDFDFSFDGVLKLLQKLEQAVDLGGRAPVIKAGPDGVRATYQLRIDDVPGLFTMRNIVVNVELDIPFRQGSPSISIAFASRESPFQLSIPPFGGGGYALVRLDGEGLRQVEASLEFGGVMTVDFKVVEAEVHALGGVRFSLLGGIPVMSAYVRLGGSVTLFGLVTLSVELRVDLTYDGLTDRLIGRATLVIELDLALYADSVELDTGIFVLAGSSAAPPSTDSQWAEYQAAFA